MRIRFRIADGWIALRRCIAPAICFAASVSALAQNPPILNSPYVCANGITYTVTACKPYRTDQWCNWVEKQNGQIVTSVNSTWTSMTGRLQGCTNAASAQSPASGAAASPAPTAAPSALHAMSPDYMKEFPTVEQVMAQMKGSSAQDTLYRQLGAFRQLKQFIEDLAGQRWYNGQLTADERQIHANYDLAYNNLAKPLHYPLDDYFGRHEFIASLFNTFPMPTVQKEWIAQNDAFAAREQARRNQNAAAAQQQQQNPNQQAATNDPTRAAARRCLELGGSMMQCMGEGLSKGFQDLLGVNLDAITGPGPSGLVLFGTWNAAGGLHFNFGDSNVDISNCGPMVQGAHSYTVQPTGGRYAIRIDNEPQPIIASLSVDGKIAAPAAQDITGQKIVGYEVHTTVERNRMTNQIVPGTERSTRTPVYGPVTVHCAVGTLAQGPAAVPDQGMAASLANAVTASAVMVGMAPGSAMSNQLLLPPGPRVVGRYAGRGGLKIQFDDGVAILDCAQAHAASQYDVALRGNVVTVAVKNGSSPFTLALRPDGSLAGSGTATVNGRLMTGLNGDTPVFAPTSASCTVDVLTVVQ